MNSATEAQPALAGVIAALPREVASLVRGVSPDAGWKSRGIWLYRLPQAIVVAAGMGPERATAAVEAARAAGPVATLISVGLAGACSMQAAAGSVLEADCVIDARTGERFEGSLAADGRCTLVTDDAVASVREKARLLATYGAAIVDMEAATVGRLARAHGLSFRAIKGVSDAHDFELASLAGFMAQDGTFRTAAFALHTALRPWSWSAAMELGRNSAKALRALEARLRAVLAAQAG